MNRDYFKRVVNFVWLGASRISHDSQGALGGIEVIWNVSKSSSTFFNSSNNNIITTFQDLTSECSWNLINVYVSNN